MIKTLFSSRGRISRKQYWLYSLTQLVGVVLLFALMESLEKVVALPPEVSMAAVFIAVIPLLSVFIILPVKRWHDTNRSTLWIILHFVPYLNILMLILVGVLKGTEGTNKYGENPQLSQSTATKKLSKDDA